MKTVEFFDVSEICVIYGSRILIFSQKTEADDSLNLKLKKTRIANY
jgi:hypothetical protein